MTYTAAATGGLLIGASAIILLLANGRIAGISGIIWSALTSRPAALWRWLFIIGMVLGTYLYHQLSGVPAPPSPQSSLPLIVVAGLLVGFGVNLGSGCTSGHGVCGLGRRSPRSLAATLTFMASGIFTVFVVRHIIGAG